MFPGSRPGCSGKPCPKGLASLRHTLIGLYATGRACTLIERVLPIGGPLPLSPSPTPGAVESYDSVFDPGVVTSRHKVSSHNYLGPNPSRSGPLDGPGDVNRPLTPEGATHTPPTQGCPGGFSPASGGEGTLPHVSTRKNPQVARRQQEDSVNVREDDPESARRRGASQRSGRRGLGSSVTARPSRWRDRSLTRGGTRSCESPGPSTGQLNLVGLRQGRPKEEEKNASAGLGSESGWFDSLPPSPPYRCCS